MPPADDPDDHDDGPYAPPSFARHCFCLFFNMAINIRQFDVITFPIKGVNDIIIATTGGLLVHPHFLKTNRFGKLVVIRLRL